jgi:hypothetical protein
MTDCGWDPADGPDPNEPEGSESWPDPAGESVPHPAPCDLYSARCTVVRMPAPLAPSYSPHRLTRVLMAALRENDWQVYRVAATGAVLRRPTERGSITLIMSPEDTTRVSKVMIGQRQVSFRLATQYARGETAA